MCKIPASICQNDIKVEFCAVIIGRGEFSQSTGRKQRKLAGSRVMKLKTHFYELISVEWERLKLLIFPRFIGINLLLSWSIYRNNLIVTFEPAALPYYGCSKAQNHNHCTDYDDPCSVVQRLIIWSLVFLLSFSFAPFDGLQYKHLSNEKEPVRQWNPFNPVTNEP